VTAPALARTDGDGRRVYVWDGRELPSVSTLIANGIPKPFLTRWAAREAATYAVDNLPRLAGLPEATAVAEIKRAPFNRRDDAASLGDAVHAVIEGIITRPTVLPSLPEGVRAVQVAPFISAFRQFDADYQPTWLHSEATVVSKRYGYAGTLDALCVLDGQVTILDVKTGNRVYPEVALQTAAYAGADFIATPDGRELELPEVTAGMVLHLRPEGYRLLPVSIDFDVFEVFLAALQVARWSAGLAESVLGAALPARGGERG
jgi:hypothetical protein